MKGDLKPKPVKYTLVCRHQYTIHPELANSPSVFSEIGHASTSGLGIVILVFMVTYGKTFCRSSMPCETSALMLCSFPDFQMAILPFHCLQPIKPQKLQEISLSLFCCFSWNPSQAPHILLNWGSRVEMTNEL